MDERIVYKYLPPSWGSVDAVVEVLEKGRIGFTQTAALNDPFENLPSVADYRDKLRIQAREFAGVDASEDHLEANFQRLLDIIQSRYVYLCLSRINYSELMWAHYSASHTGFAIGFDTGNPFFYPENEVKGIGLRPVDYSPKRVAFPADGMYSLSEQDQVPFVQSLFFTKSEDWKYEYEARLALNPQDATSKVKDANGFDVFLFNFQPTCVTEIILGCRMTPTKRSQIIALLRARYSHVRLYQASLHDREFKIKVDLLNTWI